jgi:hypothetical protein
MRTDDKRQDGSTSGKLPEYVVALLAQALRNRLRDTLLAPFSQVIESLLLDLGEGRPASERGCDIAGGGCAESGVKKT